MTVGELIEALKKHPSGMNVCVWDDEADDWIQIVEVLLEDGSVHVDLLTQPSGVDAR